MKYFLQLPVQKINTTLCIVAIKNPGLTFLRILHFHRSFESSWKIVFLFIFLWLLNPLNASVALNIYIYEGNIVWGKHWYLMGSKNSCKKTKHDQVFFIFQLSVLRPLILSQHCPRCQNNLARSIRKQWVKFCHFHFVRHFFCSSPFNNEMKIC